MVKEFLERHILFDVLSIISVGLIIASFIVPPTGVVDPSVLAAVGEIFGWGALYIVLIAIVKGTPASVQHNGTTVSVNKDGEHNNHFKKEQY